MVCAVHKCCVHHHYPVGARLARDGNLPATSIANLQTPSPAGWLPQWSAPYINAAPTTITLWERACPRWQFPCHINCESADAIASRLAPTVVCAVHKCCVHHHYPVGARLARDGNLPATSMSNVQTPSRASPAPTVICAVHKCCAHHHSTVGAGSPAMAISLPHQCRMCRRHRQQAGSHSDLRRT